MGVDGVGRTEDGRRVYFILPRAPLGSTSEKTVVALYNVSRCQTNWPMTPRRLSQTPACRRGPR